MALPTTINDREYGAFVESGTGVPAKRVVLYDAAGAALLVAAALADATANPTLAALAAYGLVFNGTTWDRARDGSADTVIGSVKAMLINAQGNRITGADVGDGLSGTRTFGVVPYLWNGASVDRARTPVIVKDIASTAITAGTPLTVWTPAGGKKFRLMGWQLSSSAATNLIFKYAAGNTTLFRSPTLAAAGVWDTPANWGNGQMPGAANDVLKVDCVANATVAGFVFGTEE